MERVVLFDLPIRMIQDDQVAVSVIAFKQLLMRNRGIVHDGIPIRMDDTGVMIAREIDFDPRELDDL